MGPTLLNHVAMSMPVAELDRWCDDVLAFYGEVFGWTGWRDTGEPGSPLIIRLGEGRQFLYVYGDADGETRARPMDHYGVEVGSTADLDAALDRARRFRGGDPRVTLVEQQVTPAGPVEVVSAYLGFVLPLMVEIQHFRSSTS